MSLLGALTRRQIMSAAVTAPFLPVALKGHQEEFTDSCDEQFLSRESQAGFAMLFPGNAVHNQKTAVVLRAGLRKLSSSDARKLRDEAKNGAWVILETALAFYGDPEAASSSELLASALEVQLGPSQAVAGPGSGQPAYIGYKWPIAQQVRPFGFVTPVHCSGSETIATFSGIPVCARLARGAGGFIYLGSMLGPNLLAEEREAHTLGRALLRALA